MCSNIHITRRNDIKIISDLFNMRYGTNPLPGVWLVVIDQGVNSIAEKNVHVFVTTGTFQNRWADDGHPPGGKGVHAAAGDPGPWLNTRGSSLLRKLTTCEGMRPSCKSFNLGKSRLEFGTKLSLV